MKPNWKNRTVFIGDNLDVMRAMNSESVDLIVFDPPFNTNRNFHAPIGKNNGGGKEDDQQDWLDFIKEKSPRTIDAIESARRVHGERMGAYACSISVRLLEMHRLLKPTGSLVLHCDPTVSHYLKACLDSIFGPKGFVNEIIWCFNRPAFRRTKALQRSHDILFWYAKGNRRTFNDPKASDWWPDIKPISLRSKERTGYPGQKPVELYERIIKAMSKEGDVILEPSCLCGTTCVAAERLGRQWVGVGICEKACEIIAMRMRREVENGSAETVCCSSAPPKRTSKTG